MFKRLAVFLLTSGLAWRLVRRQVHRRTRHVARGQVPRTRFDGTPGVPGPSWSRGSGD